MTIAFFVTWTLGQITPFVIALVIMFVPSVGYLTASVVLVLSVDHSIEVRDESDSCIQN